MPFFTSKPLFKYANLALGALAYVPRQVSSWVLYFTNQYAKLFSIQDASPDQNGKAYYSNFENLVKNNGLGMQEAYVAPGSTPNILALLCDYQYHQSGDSPDAASSFNLYGALNSSLEDANITGFVDLLQQACGDETNYLKWAQLYWGLGLVGGFVGLCCLGAIMLAIANKCGDKGRRTGLDEPRRMRNNEAQSAEVLELSRSLRLT